MVMSGKYKRPPMLALAGGCWLGPAGGVNNSCSMVFLRLYEHCNPFVFLYVSAYFAGLVLPSQVWPGHARSCA